MALTRVVCPSCQAGLKSAAGFRPGQKLRCPKCQNSFEVPDEEPEETPVESPKKKPVAAVIDDDEEERPKAKKPKKVAVVEEDDDDEEEEEKDRPRKKKKKKKKGGYKNSPIRFVILGVLLVVLGVMGCLLYQKKQNESTTANTGSSNDTGQETDPPPRKSNSKTAPAAKTKEEEAEHQASSSVRSVTVTGAAKTKEEEAEHQSLLELMKRHDVPAQTGSLPYVRDRRPNRDAEGVRAMEIFARQMIGHWKGTFPDPGAFKLEGEIFFLGDGKYRCVIVKREGVELPKPITMEGVWFVSGKEPKPGEYQVLVLLKNTRNEYFMVTGHSFHFDAEGNLTDDDREMLKRVKD